MKDALVELIVSLATELDELEGVDAAVLDADTRLFGEGGILDSMGLVSLVIAVEQAIGDRYESTVSLADEKALSQKRSPYRTIGTLAEYAAQQLGGVV